MSVLGKIKKAVKKAAQAASTAVNVVTEVAADATETLGNAAESGLSAAGSAVGYQALGNYLGGVAGGISDSVTAGVKASGGLLGATTAGTLQVAAGGLLLDGGLIKDGYAQMTSGVWAGVLLFGGKLVAGFQSLMGAEQRRPLTEAEKALVRRVFGESIALHNVRIVDQRLKGAPIFAMFGSDSAFVLGNTIYMMNRNAEKEPELFVHEMTHVWQYQNVGSTYTSDAVGARLALPDAYKWEDEIARGNTHWEQFNPEAQAELLEDIYTQGQLITFNYRPAIGPDGKVVVSTTSSTSPPSSTFPPTCRASGDSSTDGVFYDAKGYEATASGGTATIGYFCFNKQITQISPRKRSLSFEGLSTRAYRGRLTEFQFRDPANPTRNQEQWRRVRLAALQRAGREKDRCEELQRQMQARARAPRGSALHQ